MPIYGLRYHKLAQTSYFLSSEELALNTRVVAAFDQGQVMARVISGPHDDIQETGEEALPEVLRVADAEDFAREEANAVQEKEAAEFWKGCVRSRGLEMKLVDVELFLDRSKYIFYFTALSRIDFRELVKDLVHEYRVRIEFRQIGVRHETQMVGAVGNCGMVCCCRRYPHQFEPVTIRMAKEQNLFLNPAKVSGICGRLLCCLAYEQESYEKFHSDSPRLGKRYTTSRGQFKVIRTNMFSNSVTCLAEGGEEFRFSLEEWNALDPRRVDPSAAARESHEPQPPLLPHDGSEMPPELAEGDMGLAGHQPAGKGRGDRPQRQVFVTGRVHFRQQGRGRPQELWKKAQALTERDPTRKPGQPADAAVGTGQGQDRPGDRQPDRPRAERQPRNRRPQTQDAQSRTQQPQGSSGQPGQKPPRAQKSRGRGRRGAQEARSREGARQDNPGGQPSQGDRQPQARQDGRRPKPDQAGNA